MISRPGPLLLRRLFRRWLLPGHDSYYLHQAGHDDLQASYDNLQDYHLCSPDDDCFLRRLLGCCVRSVWR